MALGTKWTVPFKFDYFRQLNRKWHLNFEFTLCPFFWRLTHSASGLWGSDGIWHEHFIWNLKYIPGVLYYWDIWGSIIYYIIIWVRWNLLSGQPEAWLVKEKEFFMPAITKLRKGPHIEIQNDFQNMIKGPILMFVRRTSNMIKI